MKAIETIYNELTTLKAKSTFNFSKLQVEKRRLNELEFRFKKAKEWDKQSYQSKIDICIDRIKRYREDLFKSIELVKQFLNENL